MTGPVKRGPGVIEPGAWLGLLGGGQLGRMFAMAAQAMGYKVLVLDPGADSPAGAVADRHLRAEYTDARALDEMGAICAAVTTEFENVPAESLQRLANACTVSPAAASVAIAQDRIREKTFLSENGFEVAPFAVIRTPNDLSAGGLDDLCPGVLKVSRFGYDGKGQVRVASRDDLGAAFQGLGQEACVLEKYLALEKEVSVVVCRGFDDGVISFPVSENHHANGILDVSIVPARVAAETAEKARQLAIELARKLDYRGVLCVEFFVLEDGRLLVNEIAPRPHNSGHYTIDACVSSQFEQQARIMCSLPLGDTSLLCPAVMLNLLGDLWAKSTPPWEKVLRHESAKLHLYGKSTPRPGRKMGHVTVLAQQAGQALAVALDIKSTVDPDAVVPSLQ